MSTKASTLSIIKRIYSYIKPYRGYFAVAVFLTIFLAVISPIRPYLIKNSVDQYIIDSYKPEELASALWLIVLFILIEAFGRYGTVYFTSWLGQLISKDLRINLYKHLHKQKTKFFDNNPVGTLHTRVVSDIENIFFIFSEGLIVILGDLLQLIVIIAFMFFQSWKLTLLSLSTVPFMFIATKLFKEGIKSSFNAVRNEVAKLNTFVQEHIVGMKVVQIFNKEEEEFDKFKLINEAHKQANIKSIWYYSLFFPAVEILSSLSLGLVVWVGGRSVLEPQGITAGLIIAFSMYINMLFRPLREMADKFNTLQMGIVCSERVFNILDTDESIQEPENSVPFSFNTAVVFNNLWMSYKPNEWVLKNVNFTVNAGETVAIVGKTGSGKTSIVNLLNKFYDFQKGDIFIDGISIHEFNTSTLRSNIAVVLQDVFLFSDTIYNNITLGDTRFTLEEVEAASKAIGAHDFISKLPDGYSFNVKERGGLLSAGQRQLISFIRAFLYNPKILILDEATANIDSESEQLIQNAIEKLTNNRTSIIIAHRLATIQKANKIVVLEQGEVKEIGTHTQLLAIEKGSYRAFYETQFV